MSKTLTKIEKEDDLKLNEKEDEKNNIEKIFTPEVIEDIINDYSKIIFKKEDS